MTLASRNSVTRWTIAKRLSLQGSWPRFDPYPTCLCHCYFDNIQKIYWRNSDLDFNSTATLLSSLKKYPINNYFIHKKNALDEINFRNLINDNEIKKFLISKKNLKLLWNVSQIPDFEKLFNDNYLLLLKDIFLVRLFSIKDSTLRFYNPNE